MDVVYLDFVKTFNFTPHKRLKAKLSEMVRNGDVYNWLESFILSKKEMIMILGQYPSAYEMSSHVPQRSGLGALSSVA